MIHRRQGFIGAANFESALAKAGECLGRGHLVDEVKIYQRARTAEEIRKEEEEIMGTNHVHTLGCFIIPPDILENIADKGTQRQRDLAYQALNASAQLRGQREALTRFAAFAPATAGCKSL